MELRRNLKIDSVSRLSPTLPHVIEAERLVSAAVDLMREHRVGCLLVTRHQKLVGIFTERDLLVRVLAAGLPLSVPITEVMTANPVTVDPKDSVRVVIMARSVVSIGRRGSERKFATPASVLSGSA